MRIQFSSEDVARFEQSLKKEWLETNGIGGFAASSILGCHTRKYHGWLNVHLPELDGRYSLLSKMEATAIIGDQHFQLDCNKYPMSVYPQGHKHIKTFSYEDYPCTIYQLTDDKGNKLELAQELMMVNGENSLMLRYRLLDSASARSVVLRLSPMLTFRNVHELCKKNMYLDLKTYREEPAYVGQTIYRVTPYSSMPSLFFGGEAFEYFPAPRWNYNVEFSEEQARGFDYQEDLYCPGLIEKELKAGQSFYLMCSTKKNMPKKIADLWKEQEELRLHERMKYENDDAELAPLQYSARHFLVKNKIHGDSLIAGYPWFVEWGRDTMISVPGLAFYSGRMQEGLAILRTFAGQERQGLIPNYLPMGYGHTPAYNSVDASLWFFWALQEYVKLTGDRQGVLERFGIVMGKIIESYTDDRIPFVELRANGLLWAGNQETQLTWMDAKAYGVPVTPRWGFAVEINALWYNALGFYLDLIRSAKNPLLGMKVDEETINNLNYLFELCGRSFKQTFWNDEKKYLADYVNSEGADFSIRPNQIFAASLQNSPLDHNQKREIVRLVQENLLTPFGLRTLAKNSPTYHSHYKGGGDERDSAYHQGTVWTWPVGHFIEAFIRVYSKDEDREIRRSLFEYFRPLYGHHLLDHGLMSVAEIFDGDAPHQPNGCFAQAWSVAETIRGLKLLKRSLK